MSPVASEAEAPAGTKGQNYDRIVFDSATDAGVRVSARIMTINRFSDSAASILVTDNGAQIFGPESESAERWRRTIEVRGKGRHEVVMTCKSINSDPVFCSLNVDDAQVSVER